MAKGGLGEAILGYRMIGMRSLTAACVAVIGIAIGGCGGSAPAVAKPPTGVQHGTLQMPAGTRTYRLYAPTDLPQRAPLLLVLQGCGPIRNGDDMAALTGLDVRASSGKFIAAYPDALGCWNAGAGPSTPDDVGFIKALISKIATTYSVDRGRVYATGISSGALLAHLLGCRIADQLGGVASVAGNLLVSDCKPSRPISILELHGTDDPNIPFGAVPEHGIPSVTETMQQWARLDACGSPAQSQAGVVATTAWTSCAQGTKVTLMAVEGGHHVWFGCTGPCSSFSVPGEPNATAVVLAFLGLG